MKKILAIILATAMLLSCGVNSFAAGNMSSWFVSSTAQTMQIIDSNENLMAYDKRINPMMTLYGIYDMLGEADVDVSKVEAPFADLSNFQPYSNERKAITWLYLKGVVKGYEDGTVKANQEVSRSEFITMLIRMLENTNSSIRVSTGTSNPYNDIDGHWAYDNILKATNMGLVQGDGKAFNPNNMITKEEVITIGLRLADKMELDINDYADVIDEIYDLTIDFPIYTDGYGDYDYSNYDYVIDVDDSQNIHFNIGTISSYTTSKSGIVTVSRYTNYLKVTGKAEGVVTITAKSNNGYQDTVRVLVVGDYNNRRDSYTVRVGSTVKVYHPDSNKIKSATVTSGSSYVTVSKYTNYLSVKGQKAGTAKIKIVDTYGIAQVVTVRVTTSLSSNSYYEDYYQMYVGDYENVYATSGENIKSYSITSGSSYISVSKYSGYLRVYGKKAGTAKIEITDTYGDADTVTVEVYDDYYYEEDDYDYDYGVTQKINLYGNERQNIYFDYITGDIMRYNVSSLDMVDIFIRDRYIEVRGRNGRSGTVTITVYDRYGASESVRITLYDSSNDNTNDSRPPYRPIIYPPDYEVDISK